MTTPMLPVTTVPETSFRKDLRRNFFLIAISIAFINYLLLSRISLLLSINKWVRNIYSGFESFRVGSKHLIGISFSLIRYFTITVYET